MPKIPEGLTRRTIIKTAKVIASESWLEMYAFERISITPSKIPPINAPGIEPIPPNTAAVKALIPGIEPVYGVKVGYAEHKRAPAIAARPDPIAKVNEIVPFTLIPISDAASLSSETAIIARPGFVFPTNRESATIITIQAITVTIVVPLITSWPPHNFKASIFTTEVNEIGFEPKIKSAIF